MSDKFAKTLKRCRVATRKTQPEFSNACGVSSYTIKAWETGRSVPNFKNFSYILDGLKRMSVDTDLIEELEKVYNYEKLGVMKDVQ